MWYHSRLSGLQYTTKLASASFGKDIRQGFGTLRYPRRDLAKIQHTSSNKYFSGVSLSPTTGVGARKSADATARMCRSYRTWSPESQVSVHQKRDDYGQCCANRAGATTMSC